MISNKDNGYCCPEVTLIVPIRENAVSEGKIINELYTYVSSEGNDFAGEVGMETIAELIAGGIVVVKKE